MHEGFSSHASTNATGRSNSQHESNATAKQAATKAALAWINNNTSHNVSINKETTLTTRRTLIVITLKVVTTVMISKDCCWQYSSRSSCRLLNTARRHSVMLIRHASQLHYKECEIEVSTRSLCVE
jgi:hypothetical protein